MKHFVYDGMGRVVRTGTPLNASWFGEGYTFQGDGYRSERFFYDGVRRISDVVTDPVLMNEEGDIVSLSGEVLGGQPGNGGTTIALGTPYLRMRYVWGPGDGLGGVYELLAQYDSADKPWYVAQDAQGDVVSMMERVGTSGAQVVAQWTYSPYGVVLTSETFATASGASVPSMVFGHKGLATDRLDRPLDFWDSSGQNLFDTQRLEPGADTLVYANNRTLLPRLGRWLQSDPNASGLIVLDTLGFHGQRMHPAIGSMSLAARLRDGLALGQYVSGDPIGRSDPTGLFGGLIGILGGATTTAGMYAENAQNAVEHGASAFMSLGRMLGEYSANAEADIEWALDWSQGDDWHSRSGTVGEISSYMSPSEAAGGPEFGMAGNTGHFLRNAKRMGEALLTKMKIPVNRQYMQTSLGGRAFDGLQILKGKLIGFEVKTTSKNVVQMTSSIAKQIQKDIELLKLKAKGGGVDRCEWIFQGVNGLVPELSRELKIALKNAGITAKTIASPITQ
ncbi:MAG TPA: hypothetical protein VF777_05100 [Phycisphaerales bacterium]